VETFHDDSLAQVSLPLAEEINKCKAALRARPPLLHDCWATMDGLKLYLQQSGNTEIQKKFYNEWNPTTITYLLCFVFVVRMVGTNKIQNTYISHLHRDANVDVWF
jgi:hypothetical protein